MRRIIKDTPASLIATIISAEVASAFNRRSEVHDKRGPLRRPMTFRVKFRDCIKPSISTPFGLEEERKRGRRGDEDRPLTRLGGELC